MPEESGTTEQSTETADTPVPVVAGTLTLADRWDHFLARWGVNRGGHRAAPGLYALGTPTPASPVFVTANYTLSFDALRSALNGLDGYILVLDTHGINVWCAAGKGTFGTDELVQRMDSVGLQDIVAHRTVILPQLGASGVASFEARVRSGFAVEYGPVRAGDLPEYLKTRCATGKMRRVQFGLRERAVLIPVEIVHTFLPMVLAAALLFLLGGWLTALAVVAAVWAGVILFPLLLPWLPTREFSTKGFILGGAVALPFAALGLTRSAGLPAWARALQGLGLLLAMPAVTAFLALNFTGSTPIASKTGVEREMATYIRPMAVLFGSGLLLILALSLARILGGL